MAFRPKGAKVFNLYIQCFSIASLIRGGHGRAGFCSDEFKYTCIMPVFLHM